VGRGLWLHRGFDPVIGCFVEYETAVPEPAAAALLGWLGLLTACLVCETFPDA
jgi:hypothetical protein